ncbi:hypothetical protein A3F66_01145 [candidate division TM6 bacterium RIFCSPHIGHO2_12_FULL_32_22]|nr:MAG: hypothetical protein A3F66_01145 [candidate division TM6 bacterium RIFCSPHIGHO2_12_FULL_32_22]
MKIFRIIILYTTLSFSADDDIHPAINFVIGGTSATVENCVTQPLIYIKNRLQQQARIDLLNSYKGFVVNTAAFAPIVALQTATNGSLQSISDNNFANAFASGAASALVNAPSDLVMLHQQNTGASLRQMFMHLLRHGKLRGLYSGFSATAMREGGFASGYLYGISRLKPIIKEYLNINEDLKLTVATGAPVGLAVTAFTHPWDTIKTDMQQHYDKKKLLRNSIKEIYKKNGFSGFYKGFMPRSLTVMLSITIISQLNEALRDIYLAMNR